MGHWKSLKKDSGTGWKELYREAGSGGWKALEWDEYYLLTFESDIEGFSCGEQSSSYAYEGTYSFLSDSGIICSKAVTQRTRPYYWEFKFYAPAGQSGYIMQAGFCYAVSSSSILLSLGHPTSGEIGYYDGTWQTTGVTFGLGAWHTLKLKINAGNTFDGFYDATTLFTGKNTTYLSTQYQRFQRLAGKNVWIDNIKEYPA
jgi:hypothetical protein